MIYLSVDWSYIVLISQCWKEEGESTGRSSTHLLYKTVDIHKNLLILQFLQLYISKKAFDDHISKYPLKEIIGINLD